jgi:nucleotide-binding universal stress UspA family protein
MSSGDAPDALIGAVPRAPIPGGAGVLDAGLAWEEIEAEQKQARATAEEGARIASAAGFEAKATVLRCDGPPADELIDYIDYRAPHMVVMGTRVLSGVRSTIAGSVSHHVAQHVHVPILLVPPDARTHRHERMRRTGHGSPGRCRGSKRSAITFETA